MAKLTGPENLHTGAPPPQQLTGHVKLNMHIENIQKDNEKLIPAPYVAKAD